MKNRNTYLLDFQEIDKTYLALVGGKGANLGELSGMEGIQVPEGFCVTTEAYKQLTGNNPVFDRLLDELTQVDPEEREKTGKLSAGIRACIERTPVPSSMAEAVAHRIARFGDKQPFAVRSSATAEDLPSASFAGQQDTYLNIIGTEAVLEHIRKCWASLFTERAITYRMQNGFGHRNVYLAVVIQRMIFPEAAGILFTADPVTSSRKTVSIDAGFGLGEALVSGLVNADNYKVGDGTILEKHISTKNLAIYAAADGGTRHQAIEPGIRDKPVLTDEQIVRLAYLGRKIEAHFGQPQDIEWCLADDTFAIVQSRPITTLYPIPERPDGMGNHVYVSVGHQQMMTDVMKPLGISMWQLPNMYRAGGRLFVDVTPMLASPAGRDTILNVLGRFDPLVKDALATLVDRGDFIPTRPQDTNESQLSNKNSQGQPGPTYQALNDYDPAVVRELVRRSEASLEQLKQHILSKSGVGLMDFIRDDIDRLRKRIADPQSMGVIMTAMNAATWLNEKMEEWLGEKTVADALSQSVPGNVTSQMGLDLLDAADEIRPYPEVIHYLQQAGDHDFRDELPRYAGGPQALKALTAFLNKYGMRCTGEIDITRPRWSEQPGAIVPMLLTNIRNAEPGASKRKFEEGRREALAKEQQLLERLEGLPDGKQKAAETRRMISLVRNLSGYREYPKYHMICCYFVYKQALLKEAEDLVHAGVIHEKEDIYYLTLEELGEVVRTHEVNDKVIQNRKDEYRAYEKLTPPRVITSDGEIVTGTYTRENIPSGAMAGLAVSSGVIEGRARVILRMEEANLEEGDILVTTFTDPSWTPLFVSIKGLVTEVGGRMTHGAVIAREYGLPAVVGIDKATQRIQDGQRIRVNGTAGYVECLQT
jgi:pyruvate,water dikinase